MGQEENGRALNRLDGFRFPTWLVVVDGDVEGVATKQGEAEALSRPFRSGNYAVEIVSGVSTFSGVSDTKTTRKSEIHGISGKQ